MLKLKLFLVLIISVCLLYTESYSANPNELKEVYKDIYFVAKPVDPDLDYDITPVGSVQVLNSMKKAVDIIFQQSPYNARAIKHLQSKGRIVLIYDPKHPKQNFTKLTIASFLPEYYNSNGPMKDFVVVLGRYGGKWTSKDLAAVIAHELTGHGVQHLQGRLKKVRTIDLECEAYLYQEKVYQDLKYEKTSIEMVKFRNKLENYWCADFKLWVGRHRPLDLSNWESLNPDIPNLLKTFKVYSNALQNSGIAKRAVRIAEIEQNRRSKINLRSLIESVNPSDHYKLAIKYGSGIGVTRDPIAALKWLKKASEAGHTQAQKRLADLFLKGTKNIPKNTENAAKLYKLAASKNLASAQKMLGILYLNGEGVLKNKNKGKEWLSKAALNGNNDAKNILKKIESVRRNPLTKSRAE
ncbi:MAG: Secretory immunoglobulin A-binding protein EsiB [Alphaproteobacteria bacterium MarineAlpha3_Bin5]|nr:hypothetical protein [Magnetovibrio sp.]PPR78708.1 MAG: Secretory immunoglobulin A-binding protein EsiB [Alphaproteobacteria bacterium MarineAlpha3_Bin5]